MSKPTDQQRWKELQKRLKEARAALKANKHHDLTFPCVMRILATFGPRLHIPLVESEEAHFGQAALRGWQRRAWNALLCAEKVLPFWTTAAPMPLKGNLTAILAQVNLMETLAQENLTDIPAEVSLPAMLAQVNLADTLADAKRIVQTGTPPPRKWGYQLIPSGDGISSSFPYEERTPQIARVVLAYHAIEHSLGTVRNDIREEFNLNLSYTDESMGCDPWQIPAAIHTSWTIGGMHDVPDYFFCDNQARGEFWLWWLDEAVPASWYLEDV